MSTLEKIDRSAIARQRSNIYGLLAMVYRQEVTSDFLGQIKDPQFLGVLSSLGMELTPDFFEKPESEILEDLAVEYARLFLGPGRHISPHESVHHGKNGGTRGLLWGDSTVAVKKLIEAAGLSYRSDYRGLPDHISVELEFMQQLTLCEEQAWKTADRDKAVSYRKIEKKIIEEHLIQWVPAFCERIMKETELTFYGDLAALTQKFIEFEKKEISQN